MSIEPRYYYNFAWINPTTNRCEQIRTTTSDDSGEENVVPIPVYSYDYLMKYYDWDTGKWYYDAEMQNEWDPSTANPS